MTAVGQNDWKRRCEIPNAQIVDAADQYEAARKILLANAKPEADYSVVWPIANASALAIELYLKSLSAEEDWQRTTYGGPASIIYAKPAVCSHRLVNLFEEISAELQTDLEEGIAAFEEKPSDKSLKERLARVEDAFVTSRYPFEAQAKHDSVNIGELGQISAFLHDFVWKLEPRVFIDLDRKKPSRKA